MSAVLAYKSLFLANRARGTVEQANEGKTCTAVANGARVAVTTAQSLVPLFAVSDCLARTAHNKTVQAAASNIASSNLKNIAIALNADKTVKALDGMTKITKFLSKLGLVANITYAAAKCMDATEENKNEVLLTAAGNCAGMYLFEKIYSSAVKAIKPNDVSKAATQFPEFLSKTLPFLKSVKFSSILIGIGFVAASLLGCKFGEIVGKFIYDSSKEGQKKKMLAQYNSSRNVNTIA